MIKNECDHAYKLLDHAECLWCEDCVEKLAKRLNEKPKVTEEFIKKWTQLWMQDDASFIQQELIKMLKEVGISVA